MADHEIFNFMISNLMGAMWNAHHDLIHANRAVEQDERNMHLGNLGSNLIKMVAFNAAVIILAIIRPPEGICAYSTYMHVILQVVLGFMAVSVLASFTVGMLLLSMDNPVRYRHFALVTLWAADVATAFSIGILLVASISPA